MEHKAASLIEKLPPGDLLPIQGSTSSRVNDSGSYAFRSTPISSPIISQQSNEIPPRTPPLHVSRPSNGHGLGSVARNPGTVHGSDGNTDITRGFASGAWTLSSSAIGGNQNLQTITVMDGGSIQTDTQLQGTSNQATLARQLSDVNMMRNVSSQDPDSHRSLGTKQVPHEVVIIDD